MAARLCMSMYGFVWLCMLCMAMYGYVCYVWLCMAMYAYVAMRYVWMCMAMYNYAWPCMAIYGWSRLKGMTGKDLIKYSTAEFRLHMWVCFEERCM